MNTTPNIEYEEMTREERPGDFEGKTVFRLQIIGVNCLIFSFTDGSTITLDTEHFGMGLYGIVVDRHDETP